MTASDFDVLIVGAGIAGATLACALGNSQLKVGLIDRDAMPDWPTGSSVADSRDYDQRVSAINVGSSRVLEAVGAWPLIAERRHAPFHAMRVWDASGRGVTHFDATQLGETCFGYITENRLTTRALLDRASALDNVSLLLQHNLHHVDTADDDVTVTVSTGTDTPSHTLTTRLLVGADGGRSRIRELAGIAMPFKKYHQRTIVATVATEHHHQETAWQRFLTTGPVAYLPLADHTCSIAWHADDALAESLLELTDDEFAAQLAEATENCLGKPRLLSTRGAFPLFRGHADRYISHRLALIGDAAHVIHPLAGLGANLGIMDAACLAESLLEHGQTDPGKRRALRHFERWRQPENAAVVAATDAFYEVFGQQRRFAAGWRNAGLRLANNAGPVKAHVMRLAAGVGGDLPHMAQL